MLNLELMMMNNEHRKFCNDLAMAKGTIFVEVPLGSVWAGQLKGKGNGVQIADVININPSYTRFLIDIYECKVNRSDFFNDLRSEKWKGYLDYCNRFYFAIKKGIVNKNEIPEQAGFIVCGEKGWKTIKAAPKKNIEIPTEMLMSLLFYKKKSDTNLKNRHYLSKGWIERKKTLKRLGKKVSEAIIFYEQNTKKNILGYY